jgi:superfamily II DNA or RNA helicase
MFIVEVERIPKKKSFILTFSYNIGLVDVIKSTKVAGRKYNSNGKNWILTVNNLYEVVYHYKKSDKIFFQFKNEDDREFFRKQAIILGQKRVELQELKSINENRKKRVLDIKTDVELNPDKYIDEIKSVIKIDGFKPFPHQVVGVKFLQEAKSGGLFLDMGLGKVQPNYSKIMTPNGIKRMSQIFVGDHVIGSDGYPKKVLGVFNKENFDTYRVTFTDGTFTDCCDEHLWTYSTPDWKFRNEGYKTEQLNYFIKNDLHLKNGNTKYFIPIIKPIQFNKIDTFIHPYIMGCLLGDGGLTNGVNITNIDNDIINRLIILFGKKEYKLMSSDGKNYNIVQKYHTNKNLYIREIKKYNLNVKSDRKYIPNDYMFGSVEDRIELIKGLMDTDGYISAGGTITMELTSKKMVEQLRFMIQSLGGTCKKIRKKRGSYVKNNVRIICKMIYRMTCSFPEDIIPFHCQRKVDRYVEMLKKRKYRPYRGISKIEYIGKKNGSCIYIDSDDHLYATNSCILTHNTVISTIYTQLENYKKILIITPNSLKFNFHNEIEKYIHEKSYIVGYSKNKYSLEESKYIIINYDFFSRSSGIETKLKKYNLNNFDCLIMDEAHYIKNSKSNRYKNIKKYFNNIPNKVLMSGTPAPSRIKEIYNIMNIIAPLDFPNKKTFYEDFCGMKYDMSNALWEDETEPDYENIYKKLQPHVYRKKKEEVLKDLPDKQINDIFVEMDKNTLNEYNKIENDAADGITYENQLTKTIELRKFLSNYKSNDQVISDLIDLIVLENNKKLIFVDIFKNPLYNLQSKYSNISKVFCGDQSIDERNEIVKDFQNPNGKTKIIFGLMQVIKEGLTLTESQYMIINMLPYVPGDYNQTVDRIYRIGQLNNIQIYNLIVKETLDEYVKTVLFSKENELSQSIDNKKHIDKSIKLNLVEYLKNKNK